MGSGVGHSVTEVLEPIRQNHTGRLGTDINPGKGEGLTDWVVLDIGRTLREFGGNPAVDLRLGTQVLFSARAVGA
jgi:hypothetical protein